MSRQPIPDAALDKHVALLGMTGAGKTSVAKTGIVEPDLEAGRRVIIIDPTSAWWGLRLARAGKSQGFPIYIFGGDHGDYPLKAINARMLAEAFATSSDSAIFDTSHMTVGERTAFFTEFVETFRRKNKGWVRFVIDEAHLFMPQQGAKAGGAVPAMLHAGNNLVSLGRSRGLRVVMISQRASKLHKDSLTQASTLFALRLMHPLDRKAVKEWVEDQADPGEGEKVIASLSHLKDGEGWVWAPLAKMLERIQFQLPRTFDSSSAPDDDEGDGPTLAPINLDALKGKLATVEAERKANDPKELKTAVAEKDRKIKALEAQLTYKSTIGAGPDKDAIAAAEQRGFEQAQRKLKAEAERTARETIAGFLDTIIRDASTLTDALGLFKGSLSAKLKVARNERPNVSEVAYVPAPVARAGMQPNPNIRSIRQPSAPAIATPIGDVSFTGPQMKVLRSLAMWRALGNEQPTRAMVGCVAGYSPTSGGYANLLGGLNTMGAISYPTSGRVSLNVDGVDVISRDEGAQLLWSVLTGPQKKIVSAVADGNGHDRAQVGEATGYSPTSGGFANLLGSLRTLGIIDYPQSGQVQLEQWAHELLAGSLLAAA